MQVAEGFTGLQVTEAQWGPFLVPGELITPEDTRAIMTTNILKWGASLPEPIALRPHVLTIETIGELMMEAITAQAILSIPGMVFDGAMPVECIGRIVTVNFTPHRSIDPPVPMLFMIDLPGNTEVMHNCAVLELLSKHRGEAFRRCLPSVLEGMTGVLSRSEVFYYMLRVNSLLTGAYEQRYDTANVM